MLAVMKEPTAKLFFNQRMSSCDLENKIVTFELVVWKDKSGTAECLHVWPADQSIVTAQPDLVSDKLKIQWRSMPLFLKKE